MKIIAFTGGMGTGKSTCVNLLKEHFKNININTAVVKFAAPLYEMQESLYKIVLPVYQRSISFTKDRRLLQFLGTEWGRQMLSDTIWIDLWENNVNTSVSKGKEIILCDDVRFDNEADKIKSKKGIIIKLTSSKANERIDTVSGIKGHPSESGLANEKVDLIIENNGSIEELQSSLITALKLYSNL